MPKEPENKTQSKAGNSRSNQDAYTQAAPSSVTPAEINRLNRKYWEQPGGQTFPNHHYNGHLSEKPE